MNTAAVDALAVFDDGSGPSLFAGGTFTQAGGGPSLFMAKWQGCAPAGCGPDLNDDGVLDLFDLMLFTDWFAASHPQADWNSDGVLDFFDVIAFVGAFDAGCP